MTVRPWIVVLLAVGWVGAARADKVDDLSQKLRSDPDYKVRLSAALNLGKLGDRRGVYALVDALEDADKTVRGVSASALGKLIDDRVDRDIVDRAAAELEAAAERDDDALVRQEAARSLAAVRAVQSRRQVPAPSPSARIYIEVGPMADNTRSAPSLPAIMRRQVLSSLGKTAPSYATSWPGGRSPSESDLHRSGTTAYYVDGSLVGLTVTRSPAHVACSLSLLIATYPQKSLFAFLKGGAELDAGGSGEAAIAEASAECVNAVLDDLVTSKLVPTIQAREP